MNPAVYVINLDRSPDRLATITTALRAAGLDFERVAALEASQWESAQLPGVYDESANRRSYLAPLTPSEIACFVSHRLAWETFLTTGSKPWAIFLEDDATPLARNLDFQALDKAFAQHGGAQLIKLYHPPRWSRLLRRSLPVVPPLGAVAQAMNRAGVQSLLEFTARFHEPVDVALQRWWDHGVRVTAMHPQWFGEAAGASTIRHPQQRPPEGRIRREIRRPVFQFQRRLQALRAVLQGRYP